MQFVHDDSMNYSWRINVICKKAAGQAALVVFPEGRPQVPGCPPTVATPSHFGTVSAITNLMVGDGWWWLTMVDGG